MELSRTIETETGDMIVKRVSVPLGLEELMEGLAKEVILKKPRDIYIFAAEYFSRLLQLRDSGLYRGNVRSAKLAVKRPFRATVVGQKVLSASESKEAEKPSGRKTPFPHKSEENSKNIIENRRAMIQNHLRKKQEVESKKKQSLTETEKKSIPRSKLPTRSRSLSKSSSGQSQDKPDNESSDKKENMGSSSEKETRQQKQTKKTKISPRSRSPSISSSSSSIREVKGKKRMDSIKEKNANICGTENLNKLNGSSKTSSEDVEMLNDSDRRSVHRSISVTQDKNGHYEVLYRPTPLPVGEGENKKNMTSELPIENTTSEEKQSSGGEQFTSEELNNGATVIQQIPHSEASKDSSEEHSANTTNEEVKSAIAIQSLWRGRQERQKLRNNTIIATENNHNTDGNTNSRFTVDKNTPSEASKDSSEVVDLSADNTNEQVKAAIAIQSLWRGRKERQKLRKNTIVSSENNDKHEETQLDVNSNSGDTVLGRYSNVENLSKPSNFTADRTMEEVKSAIVLQSLWRGRRTRQTLKENAANNIENNEEDLQTEEKTENTDQKDIESQNDKSDVRAGEGKHEIEVTNDQEEINTNKSELQTHEDEMNENKNGIESVVSGEPEIGRSDNNKIQSQNDRTEEEIAYKNENETQNHPTEENENTNRFEIESKNAAIEKEANEHENEQVLLNTNMNEEKNTEMNETELSNDGNDEKGRESINAIDSQTGENYGNELQNHDTKEKGNRVTNEEELTTDETIEGSENKNEMEVQNDENYEHKNETELQHDEINVKEQEEGNGVKFKDDITEYENKSEIEMRKNETEKKRNDDEIDTKSENDNIEERNNEQENETELHIDKTEENENTENNEIEPHDDINKRENNKSEDETYLQYYESKGNEKNNEMGIKKNITKRDTNKEENMEEPQNYKAVLGNKENENAIELKNVDINEGVNHERMDKNEIELRKNETDPEGNKDNIEEELLCNKDEKRPKEQKTEIELENDKTEDTESANMHEITGGDINKDNNESELKNDETKDNEDKDGEEVKKDVTKAKSTEEDVKKSQNNETQMDNEDANKIKLQNDEINGVENEGRIDGEFKNDISEGNERTEIETMNNETEEKEDDHETEIEFRNIRNGRSQNKQKTVTESRSDRNEGEMSKDNNEIELQNGKTEEVADINEAELDEDVNEEANLVQNKEKSQNDEKDEEENKDKINTVFLDNKTKGRGAGHEHEMELNNGETEGKEITDKIEVDPRHDAALVDSHINSSEIKSHNNEHGENKNSNRNDIELQEDEAEVNVNKVENEEKAQNDKPAEIKTTGINGMKSENDGNRGKENKDKNEEKSQNIEPEEKRNGNEDEKETLNDKNQKKKDVERLYHRSDTIEVSGDFTYEDKIHEEIDVPNKEAKVDMNSPEIQADSVSERSSYSNVDSKATSEEEVSKSLLGDDINIPSETDNENEEKHTDLHDDIKSEKKDKAEKGLMNEESKKYSPEVQDDEPSFPIVEVNRTNNLNGLLPDNSRRSKFKQNKSRSHNIPLNADGKEKNEQLRRFHSEDTQSSGIRRKMSVVVVPLMNNSVENNRTMDSDEGDDKNQMEVPETKLPRSLHLTGENPSGNIHKVEPIEEVDSTLVRPAEKNNGGGHNKLEENVSKDNETHKVQNNPRNVDSNENIKSRDTNSSGEVATGDVKPKDVEAGNGVNPESIEAEVEGGQLKNISNVDRESEHNDMGSSNTHEQYSEPKQLDKNSNATLDVNKSDENSTVDDDNEEIALEPKIAQENLVTKTNISKLGLPPHVPPDVVNETTSPQHQEKDENTDGHPNEHSPDETTSKAELNVHSESDNIGQTQSDENKQELEENTSSQNEERIRDVKPKDVELGNSVNPESTEAHVVAGQLENISNVVQESEHNDMRSSNTHEIYSAPKQLEKNSSATLDVNKSDEYNRDHDDHEKIAPEPKIAQENLVTKTNISKLGLPPPVHSDVVNETTSSPQHQGKDENTKNADKHPNEHSPEETNSNTELNVNIESENTEQTQSNENKLKLKEVTALQNEEGNGDDIEEGTETIEKKEEQSQNILSDNSQKESAIRIQTIWRGFQARKKLKLLLEENLIGADQHSPLIKKLSGDSMKDENENLLEARNENLTFNKNGDEKLNGSEHQTEENKGKQSKENNFENTEDNESPVLENGESFTDNEIESVLEIKSASRKSTEQREESETNKISKPHINQSSAKPENEDEREKVNKDEVEGKLTETQGEVQSEPEKVENYTDEEINAAKKIQALFRRSRKQPIESHDKSSGSISQKSSYSCDANAENIIKAEYKQENLSQENPREPESGENVDMKKTSSFSTDEIRAAKKIQSTFRKSRKQRSKPRLEDLDLNSDSGKEYLREILKIQSAWRAYKVRKNIRDVESKISTIENKSGNQVKSSIHLSDQEILKAVTKIQAGLRGYLTRKHFNNIREQNEALDRIKEESYSDYSRMSSTSSTDEQLLEILKQVEGAKIPDSVPEIPFEENQEEHLDRVAVEDTKQPPVEENVSITHSYPIEIYPSIDPEDAGMSDFGGVKNHSGPNSATTANATQNNSDKDGQTIVNNVTDSPKIDYTDNIDAKERMNGHATSSKTHTNNIMSSIQEVSKLDGNKSTDVKDNAGEDEVERNRTESTNRIISTAKIIDQENDDNSMTVTKDTEKLKEKQEAVSQASSTPSVVSPLKNQKDHHAKSGNSEETSTLPVRGSLKKSKAIDNLAELAEKFESNNNESEETEEQKSSKEFEGDLNEETNARTCHGEEKLALFEIPDEFETDVSGTEPSDDGRLSRASDSPGDEKDESAESKRNRSEKISEKNHDQSLEQVDGSAEIEFIANNDINDQIPMNDKTREDEDSSDNVFKTVNEIQHEKDSEDETEHNSEDSSRLSMNTNNVRIIEEDSAMKGKYYKDKRPTLTDFMKKTLDLQVQHPSEKKTPEKPLDIDTVEYASEKSENSKPRIPMQSRYEAATKIQSLYRGYSARKHVEALKAAVNGSIKKKKDAHILVDNEKRNDERPSETNTSAPSGQILPTTPGDSILQETETHDVGIGTDGNIELEGPQGSDPDLKEVRKCYAAKAGVEILTTENQYPTAAVDPPSGDVDTDAQTSFEDASTQDVLSNEPGVESECEMETTKRNNSTLRNKNMEAEAATKIQAGFRGYKVRKELKMKDTPSEGATRKTVRRKSSSCLTENQAKKQKENIDLQEKSAVKIQAGIRGFLVRKKVKKPQKSQE